MISSLKLMNSNLKCLPEVNIGHPPAVGLRTNKRIGLETESRPPQAPVGPGLDAVSANATSRAGRWPKTHRFFQRTFLNY